jgi:hypothetical protein
MKLLALYYKVECPTKDAQPSQGVDDYVHVKGMLYLCSEKYFLIPAVCCPCLSFYIVLSTLVLSPLSLRSHHAFRS